MPNYYIQATRGHFNPLSFDELVKPLNMYKEYYDENEKAVTEMRSQADLWDEIMKSEGDTDLANKYNQYSQGLNDAAQQLSNGMSYNLRKQIQDLRAKSAMVKQIENAYTLRAKDIDTYNELMMKDPSRIGAFDPSQRSLNDYMRGPVTNEYGVSGDELYKKAAIAGKAMTLRSKTQSDSEDKNGVITRTTQIGFNNNNINEMLNNENSIIYQEADKILKAQGITPETSYYNAAKQEVVKGIVDGIYYDKEITYHNKPRNYNPENPTKDPNNPINIESYSSSDSGTIFTNKKIGGFQFVDGEYVTELFPEQEQIINDATLFKDDNNNYYLSFNIGDVKSNIRSHYILNEEGINQLKELKKEKGGLSINDINYILKSDDSFKNFNISKFSIDENKYRDLSDEDNKIRKDFSKDKTDNYNIIQVGDKVIIKYQKGETKFMLGYRYDDIKKYISGLKTPSSIVVTRPTSSDALEGIYDKKIIK